MVLVVVLAVQQIEGHILQPFILGRRCGCIRWPWCSRWPAAA